MQRRHVEHPRRRNPRNQVRYELGHLQPKSPGKSACATEQGQDLRPKAACGAPGSRTEGKDSPLKGVSHKDGRSPAGAGEKRKEYGTQMGKKLGHVAKTRRFEEK